MSRGEGPGTAWRTHLLFVAGIALCGAAFWFELGRAEHGNALSWAYVVEWPLLAAFAVYAWWRVLHGEPRVRSARPDPGLAPEYDAMRRAWLDAQAARQVDGDPDEGGDDGRRRGATP